MKVRPFRLRKSYVLPGVVIHVAVKKREDMEGDMGWWDYDEETSSGRIAIAADLTTRERRYVLLHELQHALVDILDVALGMGTAAYPRSASSRRARRDRCSRSRADRRIRRLGKA